MFARPTLEELLTLGKLIAAYRLLKGANQDAIARPASSTGKPYVFEISRIENDLAARPSVVTLYRIARQLRLSRTQFTHLLRASGHVPSPGEIHEAVSRVSADLNRLELPAYLMESRGYLWAWNASFSRAFGSAPAESGAGYYAPPLSPGAHIFSLLFSPTSRLRAAIEPEAFDIVARAQLARFWQTTKRLIQDAWGKEPDWLLAIEGQHAALAAPAGQLFAQLWRDVRRAGYSEMDEDLPPPVPAEIAPAEDGPLPLLEWMADVRPVDTLTLKEGHRKVLIVSVPMLSDARFHVTVLVPEGDLAAF